MKKFRVLSCLCFFFLVLTPVSIHAEPQKITMDVVEWKVVAGGKQLEVLFPSGKTQSETDVMGILEVLAKEKKAEIVSAQQITANDGESAHYADKQQKIWYLQKAQNGKWKLVESLAQAGVSFFITPTIQNDGKINVWIVYNETSIIEHNNLNPGVIGLPVFSPRYQINQTIALRSGKTGVIGSLIPHRNEAEQENILLTITPFAGKNEWNFISMSPSNAYSENFRSPDVPDHSKSLLSSKPLVQAANETYTNYLRYIQKNENGNQSVDIPENCWAKGIKDLHPVKVYLHIFNVVVVQKISGDLEEGKYIRLPISSYLPTQGVDGFTYTSGVILTDSTPTSQSIRYNDVCDYKRIYK